MERETIKIKMNKYMYMFGVLNLRRKKNFRLIWTKNPNIFNIPKPNPSLCSISKCLARSTLEMFGIIIVSDATKHPQIMDFGLLSFIVIVK